MALQQIQNLKKLLHFLLYEFYFSHFFCPKQEECTSNSAQTFKLIKWSQSWVMLTSVRYTPEMVFEICFTQRIVQQLPWVLSNIRLIDTWFHKRQSKAIRYGYAYSTDVMSVFVHARAMKCLQMSEFPEMMIRNSLSALHSTEIHLTAHFFSNCENGAFVGLHGLWHQSFIKEKQILVFLSELLSSSMWCFWKHQLFVKLIFKVLLTSDNPAAQRKSPPDRF